MLKKLRRKFVFSAVLAIFIAEVILIGAINGIYFHQLDVKSDRLLTMIAENDGRFPDFGNSTHDKPSDVKGSAPSQVSFAHFDSDYGTNPESQYVTRYFTVRTDSDGSVESVDTGHIAAISGDTAIEYADSVSKTGKSNGWADNYKYSVTEDDDSKLYVFVDCRQQLETEHQFLLISCSIALAGLLLISLLILIISKRVIRPFVESFEKQKRFITDAGHEIKTPLAIISANTEVLELTEGRSEWTDSIKNQTKRLSELIKNLLTLAKMDEEIKTVFAKFNISDAVFDSAAPFETLARSRGKNLKTDIENEIVYFGDEGMIRQLVSILLDNAVKYADDGSEICISLHRSQKSVRLTVFNPCQGLPDTDLKRIFDRFYRADSSRARETGGYGIGLSIAKAITDSHEGKIEAKKVNGGVAFEAVLPMRNEQKRK